MRERYYEGPIVVGDRFIWEPDIPGSFERIVVTAVTEHAVQSEGRHGIYWNSEDRFREAVEPDDRQADGGAE